MPYGKSAIYRSLSSIYMFSTLNTTCRGCWIRKENEYQLQLAHEKNKILYSVDLFFPCMRNRYINCRGIKEASKSLSHTFKEVMHSILFFLFLFLNDVIGRSLSLEWRDYIEQYALICALCYSKKGHITNALKRWLWIMISHLCIFASISFHQIDEFIL